MTAKTLGVCPRCQQRTLDEHCEGSKTCSWWRCRNRDCEAVLDIKRRRGFRVLDHGRGATERIVL